MASVTVKKNGAVLIRAYAGMNPRTRRQRTISKTLPPGSSEAAIVTASAELDERAAVLKGNSSTMTLSAALWWWVSKLPGKVSPSTIPPYKSYIRRHIDPRIGGVYVDMLKPAHFAELYDDMASPKEDGGGGLSLKTVEKAHSMLSGAFKYLKGNGKIAFNPLAEVVVTRGDYQEARPLSSEDYSKLVRYLNDVLVSPVTDDEGFERLSVASMVWLDLHTGLRRGELAGAQTRHWTHRAGDRGIMVARVLVYDESSPSGVSAKKPKSKKSKRFVTTDDSTNAITESYLAVRSALLSERGIASGPDAPLFCHADGSYFKPAEITSAFSEIVEEAQMSPWVHLHTLRHTHASYLIDRDGASLTDIQKRFGHSTVNVTGDIYAHMLPGRDRHLAQAAASITTSIATSEEIASRATYAPICPISNETCARFTKE